MQKNPAGPVSPHHISGLHLSILFGSTMAYVGIALPFFPVLLAAKGLTDSEISIVIAASLISRLLGNPIVTAIADRWAGLARALAACTMVAAVLTSLLIFASGFWPILGLVICMSLAQGSLMPMSDAVTMGEIRRRAETHEPPLDYGRIRVWGSGTVFAVMLIGGGAIEWMPGQGIAILLAFTTMLPILPALALARQGRGAAPRAASPQSRPERAPWAPIAALILSSGLVQASHAVYYSFSSLHWKAQGLGAGFVGTAWAVGVLCEIVFFVIAGRVFGGERNAVVFLLAGAAGCLLRWSAMTADPGPVLLMGLQSLHALTFAATHLGSVYLLSRLAGPGFRAQAQGWMAATASCAMTIATIVVGQIYADAGESVYWIMSAMAATGMGGFIIVARMLPSNR